MPKHIKTVDILNTVHGKLTITEDLGTTNHVRFVMVKCECGVIKKMRLASIRNGAKSCGCETLPALLGSLLKHGMAKDRLYSIWSNMRRRCYEITNIGYEYYGGRGITVCEEWRNNFISFCDWAYANGYKEGLTLDRKENDGNYEPYNCRWIPEEAQARNKRTNKIFTYNRQSRCLAEWCEIYGLNYKLSHQRIFRDKISFSQLIYKGDNSITA